MSLMATMNSIFVLAYITHATIADVSSNIAKNLFLMSNIPFRASLEEKRKQ